MLAGDLQGFPNGRRLTDDVVDIELQAVEGAAQTGKLVDALAAGDKVDANDNAFGDTFPYVALPTTRRSTPADDRSVRTRRWRWPTSHGAGHRAPARRVGGGGADLVRRPTCTLPDAYCWWGCSGRRRY